MLQLLNIDMSPAELEFRTAQNLRSLLGPRGLTIRHNGTAARTAPGNTPDIDIFNGDVHIIVETTKMTRVAQTNAEATPIAAHLDAVASQQPGKLTYCLFVSPMTAPRTSTMCGHYNHSYAGQRDRKIACLDFNAFNMLVDWLESPGGAGFNVADLCAMLEGASAAHDDASCLEFLNTSYLKLASVDAELDRIRQAKLSEKYQRLDSLFKGIHDDLRSVVGLGPAEAFHELSKLVFLKMYDEQEVTAELEAGRVVEPRFSMAYVQSERARRRTGEPAVHPIVLLFNQIRDRFRGDGLFDDSETLNIQPDKDEGSYIDDIVGVTENYRFLDPDIPTLDVKGMIYEQFLGLSLKNTDLGQFFTPESVIDFLVRLADPTPDDRVLDPACGTGRFLVHAMNAMLAKATDEDARERIKAQLLHGGEKSPYVAKIAKMNMYVHGDGRSNIVERDSLAYFPDEEEAYSLILTNPPLGDINFTKLFPASDENADWYEAMDVIPRRIKQTRGGPVEVITMNNFKGGALFLNKFLHYTRPGSRVMTVIDDAILNIDDYAETRDYLLRHFYLKAVFSITEDAFKHSSETATKTSLLYMVRKGDPSDAQVEPVFFAHAFQVGIDARGRFCPNDLVDVNRPQDILRAYRAFESALNENREAHGGSFDADSFAFAAGALEGRLEEPFSAFSYFAVAFDELDNRLEYKWYDPTFTQLIADVEEKSTVALGDIADSDLTNLGLTATGQPEGEFPFINIENLLPNGSVDTRGIRYVDGSQGVGDRHTTAAEDILVSRSRLPGIAAVVSEAEAGMVFGSYILRVHLLPLADCGFLPDYVALMINSPYGQAQVHRLKSGSNGYNINTGQLNAIRIPVADEATQRALIQRAARQRAISSRLVGLMRQLGDATDALTVGAHMDPALLLETDERFGEFEGLLLAAETAAEAYGRDVVTDDALLVARKHFPIRPTYYGKL